MLTSAHIPVYRRWLGHGRITHRQGLVRGIELASLSVGPSCFRLLQVIHRLHLPYKGDELHHSGWNACSSCFNDPTTSRKLLILPGLVSGRVYGERVAGASHPFRRYGAE